MEKHRLRVSENRVLRRIFGPKREEVAGGWRRQHNEELHNLYTSRNIVKVIKSRRMRWTEHVSRMGAMRNSFKFLVGNPEGKRPLEDLGVDGRIISEWILQKQGGKMWTEFISVRIGTSGVLL
jgi:hypothetical protein